MKDSKQFIKTTIREFLNESYNITNDEFGNNMVYRKGDYKMLVNTEYSPTHITLWYDNYKGWEKVGALTVNISERRFDFDTDFDEYKNSKYLTM